MSQTRVLKLAPHWFMTEREPAEKLVIKKERRLRSLTDVPEMVTCAEIAAKFKCHVDHVYDLIKAGELECQPFGKKYLIPLPSLLDYLERKKINEVG